MGRQFRCRLEPLYGHPYRAFLESFIRLNGITSLVDVGCGDWQFSRFLDLTGVHYLGLDVVPSIIETNRSRFASASVRFALMPENASSVPQADLLVIKDVLQHLNTETILKLQQSLFPRFKYCLITNSYQKLDTPLNTDIAVGSFRCLDLSAPPFSLDGSYVLEFASPLWERIRTFLHQPAASRRADAGRRPAVGRDVVMLQTADPFVYRPMLDLTSRVNIEYCRRHGIGYENYVGIKSGVVPWMASYNRLFMLNELVGRGHRGWVIFADADAFVADLEFDIRGYLARNSGYCLIGASGGSDAPWNINSGILLINLGDTTGRGFVADWLERFERQVPADYLASPESQWDEYPNDQGIMYECILYLPDLLAKTKREHESVFNYHHGQFMHQAIRAGHPDMADRLAWVRRETELILPPG